MTITNKTCMFFAHPDIEIHFRTLPNYKPANRSTGKATLFGCEVQFTELIPVFDKYGMPQFFKMDLSQVGLEIPKPNPVPIDITP